MIHHIPAGNKLAQVIGWLGVLCVLAAYLAVTLGGVSAKSVAYQVLNLVGALGIIYETWQRRDLQPVVLNVIWALAALVGLLGFFRRA